MANGITRIEMLCSKRLQIMLGIEWVDLNVGHIDQHTQVRGSMTVHRLESAINAGMIATAGFHRPPELLTPNFMMLQLHTTGLKSRAVGHQNEVSAWSLMTPNKNWRSFRSNGGIRTCTNPDQPSQIPANVNPNVRTINEFYPAGISY